ncbi:hypothetical protein PR048_026648, partial [Dryococelus australis]
MARICKPAAIKEYGVSGITLRKDNCLLPGEIFSIIYCHFRELREVMFEITTVFTCPPSYKCVYYFFESTGSLSCSLSTHYCKVQFKIKNLVKYLHAFNLKRGCPCVTRMILLPLQDLFQENLMEQFLSLKKPSEDVPKYPTVAAVVRASLALSHGRDVVERGFALSCRALPQHRVSMNKETLDAYMS